MSVRFSNRDIAAAHRRFEEAKSVNRADESVRTDIMRFNKKDVGAALLDIGEVGATSMAWGVIHGRFGVIQPAGVSLDLILGALIGAAGVFQLGGPKVATHLTNVGSGCLASFLNRKGVQIGTNLRAGAPLTNPALPGQGIFGMGGEFARLHGGMPGARAGASFHDAELEAMTRAAARHPA